VLLSDLHMPKMNGLELIQEVQKKPELKHLIILSESHGEEQKERTLISSLPFSSSDEHHR
jgi:CheY-like chemotaxis protein